MSKRLLHSCSSTRVFFVDQAIQFHGNVIARRIVTGRSANDITLLQKKAMATMFNQPGIWSGRWEMFLDVKGIAAPNTPGPLTPKPRPTPIRAAVRSSPPAKRSRLPTSSAVQCTSKPGPSRTPPSYLSSKPGPSRALIMLIHVACSYAG